MAIERFAYRPLRDAPRIAPLITALGVSFVLENTVLLLFGGFPRSYSTPTFISFNERDHIGGVRIDSVELMIIVLSVVLMFGLHAARRPHHARQVDAGRRVRPRGGRDARDRRRPHDRADLLHRLGDGRRRGRDVRPAFNQISNTIGFLAGLKAFTAAVVGGIGSIPGAMVGGLLIGLCESFSARYISTKYSDLIVFGILIADDADPADRDLRQAGAAEGLRSSERSDRSASTSGSPQSAESPRPGAGRAASDLGLDVGVGLVAAAGARPRSPALAFGLLTQRQPADGRLHVHAVRDPRARAQHRGRLGGPARPRLHRVLRLWRLRLRDLLLDRARARAAPAGRTSRAFESIPIVLVAPGSSAS